MATRMLRLVSLVLALSAASAAGCAGGCGKSGDQATAENFDQATDTVTEDHDGGTVSWYVGGDGKVKAQVKGADGKPVDKVAGSVTSAGTKADLKVDDKSKLLVAEVPKLQGGLNEVKYTLTINGKPWNGALHLPDSGTAGLVDSAAKASSKSVPTDKPGPNGGTVQVVGDDVVEIVADKNTGQVRVYILDSDLKPVPVGDRKLRLAIPGNNPEIVELVPSPDGYAQGKLTIHADPPKLTVMVGHGSHVVVALVGYQKGKHVVVRTGGPPVHLLVVNPTWTVVKVDAKDDKHDKHDDKNDPPGKSKDNPGNPGKGNDNGKGNAGDKAPPGDKGNGKKGK